MISKPSAICWLLYRTSCIDVLRKRCVLLTYTASKRVIWCTDSICLARDCQGAHDDSHARWASVHEHEVRMIGPVEKLMGLDMALPHELSVDIIQLSLPPAFDGFVVNFNMKKLEATLENMVNMLSSYEATMKKEKLVLLVGSSSRVKKGPKGKGKKRSAPTKKNKSNKKPKMKASKPNKSEQVCFHCNEPGHWLRNCKEYLAQKHSEKGDSKNQETWRG